MMTVGHCLRDHGTDTKNNFNSVTQSLKYIEKDYHRARRCVLSPHFLLVLSMVKMTQNIVTVLPQWQQKKMISSLVEKH